MSSVKNSVKVNEIKRTIIIGTYGMVYKAIHKKTKETRAIKMIMKESTAKEEEEKLMSEINVLKELVFPLCNTFLGSSAHNENIRVCV